MIMICARCLRLLRPHRARWKAIVLAAAFVLLFLSVQRFYPLDGVHEANEWISVFNMDLPFLRALSKPVIETVQVNRSHSGSSFSSFLSLAQPAALLYNMAAVPKVNQHQYLHANINNSAPFTELEREKQQIRISLSTDQAEHKHQNPINETSSIVSSGVHFRLAVLVIACNRPSVTETIDQLLQMRRSAENHPVVVSQDCGHAGTEAALSKYGKSIILIKHTNNTDIAYPVKPGQSRTASMMNYFKISRHYRWALTQVFDILNFTSIIVLEDDMELAPDFLQFFEDTYTILERDPSVWCISAWNDHGLKHLVRDDPELLWRTDFFPGLGWMIRNVTWQEIKINWPLAFWDDWMRESSVRKGRQCISPEIPRVKVKLTASMQTSKKFYTTFLEPIVLNHRPCRFSKENIELLSNQTAYQAYFRTLLHLDSPSASFHLYWPDKSFPDWLNNGFPAGEYVNVFYTHGSKEQYTVIASALGMETTLYDGLPRMSYDGVVHVRRDTFFVNVIANNSTK